MGAEQVYLLERERELEELAQERAEHLEFPEVYPQEKQAVRGLWKEVKALWKKGEKTKEYVGLLLRIADAYKARGIRGVEGFMYENLDGLVSTITSGKVEDFDQYRDCEHGDSALALLCRFGGTMELVEQSLPELKREIFYPGSERGEAVFDKGVILVICGYGATLEPYKGIFSHFNLPVIAYQLPHGVIHEDPKFVDKTFDQIHEAILQDPLLDKVTHVIGNSIGTMFASRLSGDLCNKSPDKNIKTALVQVGRGWQGAVEKTHTKFGRQVRGKLKKLGLTLEDFSSAVKKYNPGELVDELSEYIDRGQLELSLFVGLGDKVIYPAHPEVDPLLEKLDQSRAGGKYDAFTSEVAGHNSAMLLFLWLMQQKATEWARVFKGFDPEADSVQTSEKTGKYHTRKAKRGKTAR